MAQKTFAICTLPNGNTCAKQDVADFLEYVTNDQALWLFV